MYSMKGYLSFDVGIKNLAYCRLDENKVIKNWGIINLNENYEGGDVVFYDPTDSKKEIKRVRCKKGTIIFFPSNYLFPHSIEPITKGTRYSLVSWLI